MKALPTHGIDQEVEKQRILELESLISEEGRLWLEGFSAGSLGSHELLDRTNLVGDLLEQYILNHPACLKHPRWYQLADRAVSTLRDLYQSIGSEQTRSARAQACHVTEDSLTVDLTDGRTIAVPLVWYPRLVQADPEERSRAVLTEDGLELSWPDLDENISIESLLIGRPSGESQDSLERWLQKRRPEGMKVEAEGSSKSFTIPEGKDFQLRWPSAGMEPLPPDEQ